MDREMQFNPMNNQLLAQLETARRQLVETGTRNRLIHVNRKVARSNLINIVNERSDDVFRILRRDGKRMKFWATGTDRNLADGANDDTRNEQLVLLEKIPEAEGEPDEARYMDDRLETKLGPDGQQKRLLKIFRDARTAEEEQGINVLYLALGFLKWFESPSSEVEREAPLILLPVDLVRNLRTSTYDVVMRDDEITTNLPLKEKLENDFGLYLPEIGDIDDVEWTPGGYFDLVEEAVSPKERWSVDRNGMQLGFFSFAKLLMLHDLDPENWPAGGLMNSPLLSSLLNSTFVADSPLFGDRDNLDEILDPGEMFHVLDADRSQAIVIEEVRKGRNLVVQGPPGTGKSQTITNIIAAAVNDGKKVLFVAEKMAALSVVHDRLRKTGLEHVALELHSKAANKRRMLEELDRTLNAGAGVTGLEDNADAVRITRDKLNAITRALHTPVSGCALSPFDAMAIMSSMTGKGVPASSVDAKGLAALPDERINPIFEAITAFGKLAETDKTSTGNPFRGAYNIDLQPPELARLARNAGEISDLARKLAAALDRFLPALGMSTNSLGSARTICKALEHASNAPGKMAELVPSLFLLADNRPFLATLDTACSWSRARAESRFVDSALHVPAGEMRTALAAGLGSFLARLGSRYRTASASLASLTRHDLPAEAAGRVALADSLIELQMLSERFQQSRQVLRDQLGELWTGESTDFASVREALSFIRGFRRIAPSASGKTLALLVKNGPKSAQIAGHLASQADHLHTRLGSNLEPLQFDFTAAFNCPSLEDASLPEMAERLEQMSKEQHRYDNWRRYRTLRAGLSDYDLDHIASAIEMGETSPEQAIDEIRYARAEAAWEMSRNALPVLGRLGDIPRHGLVGQFKNGERDRMKNLRKVIAANHLASVPTGAIGEMGYLRSQIARKRGHAPIRKLMQTAGPVIQQIRPVFLMSPISVAQFLPPDSVGFDLLVIDEASQIKPEDAFGAIARARQIVIVGDQKQLPPTAFFDKMTSNSDHDDDDYEPPLAGYATEAESILSLCDSRQLPSRMLSWHYRSRDPSLIKVSNVEFYDQKLVLPPSPLEKDADYGLQFVRVDGVYTPRGGIDGKPGTNLIEAEQLVEAVKAHARDTPDISLGIATFNIAQRDCVSEVLERERRKDDVLDEFLREGRGEDVFVKNIENVQGDERDVIMISVGYGPRLAGQRLASTNFGPVNKEGGHRRLNVLFSRARVRCVVFCSFDPGDIPNDGRSEGVRVFKRYLEFAETGKLDQATATGGLPDSPFESDVASHIRDLGYTVEHQIGSGGFRIDLGVLHPKRRGQYMIAIECDGATYHSSLWSRERDRLRQEVLEHLGWTFHRIWSTDWFFRREQEKARLRKALEDAAQNSNPGASISGANKRATAAKNA